MIWELVQLYKSHAVSEYGVLCGIYLMQVLAHIIKEARPVRAECDQWECSILLC